MADMKLVDGGAHSVGVNNDNSRQYVSATPKGTLTSVVEFTNVGGVLGQPTVENVASGLISTGTELFFKNSGSNTLVRAEVGGVSVSGGGVGSAVSSGDITLSSSGFGGTVANVLDGNTTSSAAYTSTEPNGTQYIQMLFSNRMVGKFDWYSLVTSERIKDFKLQSYDGTSWSDITTLVAGSGVTGSGTTVTAENADGLKSVTFTPIVCQGLRFYAMSSQNIGDPNAGVTEVVIYVASPYTYTLSSLSPALTGAIGDWTAAYKIRSDKTKPLMYLAAGQTDEPLVKETALTLAGSGTTASQVVTEQASSILPYFATGNLSRDLIVTVGGVDSVVQPNGTVTETGTGPYTTTIPIPTQASAPTAAKIANRFTTAVDIDTVTYVAGPEFDIAGEATTLTDDPTLKRLALKVRGDTAVGVRSKDWLIETTEKVG